jgi:hypothetical protein
VPFTVYPVAATVCLSGHHLNNNGTSVEMLRSRKLARAPTNQVFDRTNVANKRIYNVKILRKSHVKLSMQETAEVKSGPTTRLPTSDDQLRSVFWASDLEGQRCTASDFMTTGCVVLQGRAVLLSCRILALSRGAPAAFGAQMPIVERRRLEHSKLKHIFCLPMTRALPVATALDSSSD